MDNTGVDNTAVGASAMSQNVCGGYNAATGVRAMIANTSVDGDTANGMNALASNANGVNNTAIGFQALPRPVTFRCQKPFNDGSKPIQYGRIADEVADVLPDLVTRSADGQIETVKNQVLDSLLPNEMQRQRTQITYQKDPDPSVKRAVQRAESCVFGLRNDA